jgi:TRAP-type C4-dicarboxylate transport system permease small subunit
MDEVVVVVVLLLVVVAVVVSSAMVLLDLSSMAWSDEVASFCVIGVDHY